MKMNMTPDLEVYPKNSKYGMDKVGLIGMQEIKMFGNQPTDPVTKTQSEYKKVKAGADPKENKTEVDTGESQNFLIDGNTQLPSEGLDTVALKEKLRSSNIDPEQSIEEIRIFDSVGQ